MLKLTEGPNDFWAGSYRGRHVALLRRNRCWLVYLDHVMSVDIRFETADDATKWLCREIDKRMPELA